MSKHKLKQPLSDNANADEDVSMHLEKVAIPNEGGEVDPRIDWKISRQLDKHIVPWLFGLWLLSFIDRSNIGNAKIDGLATQLDLLKDNRFNSALAIFNIPYILVDSQS
jgi:hypothetical protein